MKTLITMIVCCLLCFLGACTPKSETPVTPLFPDSRQGKTQGDGQKAPVSDPGEVRGLVFAAETADPQDMRPVFDNGSISVNATLFLEEGGCYGQLIMTRSKPQSGLPGEMTLQYESLLFEKARDMSAEARTALERLADGDRRRTRLWGSVLTCTRVRDHRYVETPNGFLSPVDYTKNHTEISKIPFLLTVDEDDAAWYLYLHSKAVFSVEGSLKEVPPTAPAPARLERPALYLNERAMTPETEGMKRMHRLVLLAERDGASYQGRLFYSRTEEKSVAPGVFAKGKEAVHFFEDVEIRFSPFIPADYRAQGGQLPEQQTARLSHMAVLEFGGQPLLFTAAGSELYAELPGTDFSGSLRGELCEATPQLQAVARESVALYEAEALYYGGGEASQGIPDAYAGAMEGLDRSGITLTDEQLAMMEAAVGSMGGMLNGQSRWLPDGFVPVQAPLEGDFIEQPPTSVYGGRFTYIEDNLFVEDILPAYLERFGDMRDFNERGGDLVGHRAHDIAFRYGDRLFLIDMLDTPAGCAVTLLVF